MKTYETNYTLVVDDEDVEVTVEYTATPYVPAQTYGPPENCYPAEGGDIEIVSVTGPDGKKLELSAENEDRLMDYLYESHEEDVDDYPEYD